MNPFKSSLDILYQFNVLNEGLKITPIHYFRYIGTLCVWLFGGALITIAVSELTGNTQVGAFVLIPFGLVFLYGAYRIHLDLKWTYGSQIINSVTITDVILTVEVLEQTGGTMHFIRNFFDLPKRNVVDILNLPISSVLDFNFLEEYVNDDNYFSLIASFAVEDDNNELSTIDVPISPRLRKLSDIESYAQIIAQFITIDSESE